MKMLPLLFFAFFIVGCADSGVPTEGEIEQIVSRAESVKKDADRVIKRLKDASSKHSDMLRRAEELLHVPSNPLPKPDVKPDTPAPKPDVKPDTPTPKPDNPQPKPISIEPEDGKFAMAKAVFRIAMGVDSPDKVTESHALADVFEAVAAKVAAGGLNGTLLNPQWKQVSNALATGNKPVIEAHKKAWEGPSAKLGAAIGTVYSDGKLDTNEDWHDILIEIARGLRAVQ